MARDSWIRLSLASTSSYRCVISAGRFATVLQSVLPDVVDMDLPTIMNELLQHRSWVFWRDGHGVLRFVEPSDA
jgi:hypothetical protein